MKRFKTASIILAMSSIIFSQGTFAETLKIKKFLAQPQHFGVTSTLIETDNQVLLVNAQFSKSEALRLAAEILDSGKTLNTIFISYGDPDFYFGLDVFKHYFPQVNIIATPETVKHIQQTKDLKLKYWSPQMGENAPTQIIVPQSYTAKTLKLDHETIEIKGRQELTYLWLPSVKAVVGGIPVSSGIHLWMADTPSTQDRTAVVKTLESIKALHPKMVVPAHMVVHAPEGLDAVNFSIDYLKNYEQAVKNSQTAEQLTQIMQRKYPKLQDTESLGLGAKVVKGETKWP